MFFLRTLFYLLSSLSNPLYLTVSSSLILPFCVSPLLCPYDGIVSEWRMLWVPYFERLYLKRGANWTCFFFSASVLPISSTTPPSLLFFPSLSRTICVTILTSIFLSLSSLSGSAGRKCHSLGGRHGPDLLPTAELRWINRGHPESPPADSFLQWH